MTFSFLALYISQFTSLLHYSMYCALCLSRIVPYYHVANRGLHVLSPQNTDSPLQKLEHTGQDWDPRMKVTVNELRVAVDRIRGKKKVP